VCSKGWGVSRDVDPQLEIRCARHRSGVEAVIDIEKESHITQGIRWQGKQEGRRIISERSGRGLVRREQARKAEKSLSCARCLSGGGSPRNWLIVIQEPKHQNGTA
jgi:hypothetical protein